jgi:cell division protein FtsL
MIARLLARASLRGASAGPRRSLVLLIGACILIAATAAICQVWTRMRALEYGYKLSKASALHARLLESNRRLRLEVAVLTSPTRIAEVAAGELGLRPPSPEQIRRIRWRGARPPAEVASRVSASRTPAAEPLSSTEAR